MLVVPDPIAAHNERVKLSSGALNALAITLIALGFIRPLSENKLLVVTDDQQLLGNLDRLDALKDGTGWSKLVNPELQPYIDTHAPGFFASVPSFWWFLVGGVVLHLFARYLLRYLRKAA